MGVASNHGGWREPIRDRRNQPRPSSDVGVEKTGTAERIVREGATATLSGGKVSLAIISRLSTHSETLRSAGTP